jgi:hypothetical protein
MAQKTISQMILSLHSLASSLEFPAWESSDRVSNSLNERKDHSDNSFLLAGFWEPSSLPSHDRGNHNPFCKFIFDVVVFRKSLFSVFSSAHFSAGSLSKGDELDTSWRFTQVIFITFEGDEPGRIGLTAASLNSTTTGAKMRNSENLWWALWSYTRMFSYDQSTRWQSINFVRVILRNLLRSK